jgi:tetratricopeptide (TPR) repeat protein
MVLSGLALNQPQPALALWGFKSEASQTPDEGADAPKEAQVSERQPGVPQNADEYYERGVELFKVAQIQAEKGNLSGQKNLLKEAIKSFEEAVKLSLPKDTGKKGKDDADLVAYQTVTVSAQSNVGFAYLTLRQYGDAIKAFERALEMNPKHLNTLNGLATTYALDKKIEQSLETFQQLTTLDPGNPQFFFNMGSVLQKVGQVDEAKDAYLQALKLDPRDQRALFNLATLYENQGLYEEAKPYYQQAKNLAIENPIGLEALRRLERLEQAANQPAGTPVTPDTEKKPSRKKSKKPSKPAADELPQAPDASPEPQTSSGETPAELTKASDLAPPSPEEGDAP